MVKILLFLLGATLQCYIYSILYLYVQLLKISSDYHNLLDLVVAIKLNIKKMVQTCFALLYTLFCQKSWKK